MPVRASPVPSVVRGSFVVESSHNYTNNKKSKPGGFDHPGGPSQPIPPSPLARRAADEAAILQTAVGGATGQPQAEAKAEVLNACSQNMAKRALQALIKEALWVRILHMWPSTRDVQQSHSASRVLREAEG